MNSEIKGNVIIFNIEETLDDVFAAFFYDELISYVNSKYYNYVIDIAAGVKVESVKCLVILLSLASFCAKNKGVLVISTVNQEFSQLLKLSKLTDNFKMFETIEKAMAKFTKK